MVVGLLGLQGAFRDHVPHLQRCAVRHCIVRDAPTLAAIDRLIIPGGESTVMFKFLKAYRMLSPLKARIAGGMPVWGICAGAIVLAQRIDHRPGVIGALEIAVTRNAYGRQLASSLKKLCLPTLGATDFPAIFIRAPRIDGCGSDVQVHARCGEDPVFVQSGRVMATTFHPELTEDDRFHRYFLNL